MNAVNSANLETKENAFNERVVRKLFRKPPEKEPALGGFIIQVIRFEHGLTYDDFLFFGFGQNTIRYWATGKADPKFDNIEMICDFYHRDIAEAITEAKRLRSAFRRVYAHR